MAMMQLPQELLDSVFELLQDDATTLRASSLVHTQWINPCRRQLFASVTLRHLHDLRLWEDVFTSTTHSPARYVRKFSATGLWASLGDEEFNLDELKESLLGQFQSFNRVRTLVLTALNIHFTLSPGIHFSHIRSSLTSLEFCSPFATTPTKILHFICSFPHLESLSIMGLTSWLCEAKDGRIDLQHSPPFRGTLKLVGFSDPGGTFLANLVTLPNGINFRSINLDFVRPKDYQHVGCLVQSCLGRLRTLHLGSSFARGLSVGIETCNLAQNRGLLEVDITITALRRFSCSEIEALLSSITTTETTFVTVRIVFMPPFETANQFKSNDWNSLDAILTRNIDRGITMKALIQLSYGPDSPVWGGVISLVETVLPRMKARGLVAAASGIPSQK